MFEFLKKKKQEPDPVSFTWLDTLYLGDSVRGTVDEIRDKIQRGTEFEGPLVILLSTSLRNQLDLISVRELIHPYYRNQNLKIVGIAGNRGEAERLLLELLQECVNHRGDGNMRAYLEAKFRIQEKEAEI